MRVSMVNYLDKILYLYPDIQRVSYWHTQYDGKEWADPYDGIVWENIEIKKPSKKKLDDLNDNVVMATLLKRKDDQRKLLRDEEASENLVLKCKYQDYLKIKPGASFSTFLDELENTSIDKIMNPEVELKKSEDKSEADNKIEQLEQELASHKQDMRDAFSAIQGFLMVIPDLRKSISQIQEKLNLSE